MPTEPDNRTMVFISHANPEENDFARWLTLQLANEGYPVWCDVTKLLGGEKFWEDIQEAIKNNTTKFLFVLTRASNQKSGTLDELNCALGVEKRLRRDIVVTLRLDDLPFDEVYINIQRRNHIDFTTSWALGLTALFKKLKEDQVPTSPTFTREAVCSWWRSQTEFSAEQGVLRAPDEHLSNWFRIRDLPSTIHRHLVMREGIGKIEFDTTTFAWPAVKDTDLSFLSFAKAGQFENDLPLNHFIERSEAPSTQDILDRTAPRGYPAHLTQLLRLAWERRMDRGKLPSYELSGRSRCYFFTKGLVDNDRLFFDGVRGRTSYRDVVGYSTRLDYTRYWHFGINARPTLHPFPHYIVKGHVLFSNDGSSIWKSKDKLARARRSQCKNWWNDEWRDRMTAVMTYLADAEDVVTIPVSPDISLSLSSQSEVFTSPVSYVDPEDIVKEDDHDDYNLEEDDDFDDLPDDDGEET